MKPIVRQSLNALFYVVIFILLQFIMMKLVTWGYLIKQGSSVAEAFARLAQHGSLLDTQVILVSTLLSSVFTIVLFVRARWTPISRDYLGGRPWAALLWTGVAAIGTIVPSVWLNELFALDMPEHMERLFTDIMRRPMGYLFIGILAPVAEEIVFRGAVLRSLLTVMQGRWRWVAIACSAVIFGVVHGNNAQFLHAALIGLLLGWMYERTRSIVPGLIFHWINNSVPFVFANLYPGIDDVKLIELAGGSELRVALWLVFSLCIFVPALYQLNRRLRRGA
ncbi:CPBP family intramembrane metalloprotease [Prevotella sp. A2931]|uniref:CPBP family intramembrane metalloprotease n=1 Tax=Prevotella illustrans TaxID=2800387 RepID=A0ABS3M7B0_9BACT|nr:MULTISPECIES: CPBP family intramembrane glutamic endopeptidase [Prevotella]MBO1364069.1 CPBP family intramembrane metalloprotease [Prevotella illustrans]PTL26954.1 CPBP family intramembrane metalloprotease [Prevotella sp. oral taxon 820]